MGLFNFDAIDIGCGVTVKRVGIPDEMLFREFSDNNEKERIGFHESFYYLLPMTLCGTLFEFFYCVLDDYLCVYKRNRRSGVFSISGAILNRRGVYDLHDVYMKRFVGILSRLNKGHDSIVMSAEHMADYGCLKSCKHSYEYHEFIFRCSDLINLEGRKYKSRRHTVNKFKTDNPNFVFRPYTPDDYSGVNDVYNSWLANYRKRYPKEDISNDGLFYGVMEVISSIDRYKMSVCEINGRIEGFIVTTPLCRDTGCVLMEYTNLDIAGMTEFMWYESLRDLPYTYENDGGGGSMTDGLYKYKNSHGPVALLKARIIYLNEKGHKVKRSIFEGGAQ